MTTANMNLTLPTPTVTTGPLWANELNSNLSLIDNHDHTTGKGMLVPVAGLDINDDLPLGGLYGVEQARYLELALVSGSIPNSSLFRISNGNLYYKNTSGVNVQLTSGASVAAPVSSGWTNLAPPAAAIYNGGVFELWEDDSVGNEIAGAIQCGPVAIARTSVGAPFLTLTPSSSMSSGYIITFPPSEPVSDSVLSMDASGVVTNVMPDATTIEISGGIIQVKALGIDTAQLADDAVETAKINNGAVTQVKLGPVIKSESASDTGAFSQLTSPGSPIQITNLTISSMTLAANRPVFVCTQASKYNTGQTSFFLSTSHDSVIYLRVTDPAAATSLMCRVGMVKAVPYIPSALGFWYTPLLSGNYSFDVFAEGVGGASLFGASYIMLFAYQP